MTDKQFQQAMLSSRIPDSFAHVGKKEFTPDAWRDMKEWFESLDVWNFLCAVVPYPDSPGFSQRTFGK